MSRPADVQNSRLRAIRWHCIVVATVMSLLSNSLAQHSLHYLALTCSGCIDVLCTASSQDDDELHRHDINLPAGMDLTEGAELLGDEMHDQLMNLPFEGEIPTVICQAGSTAALEPAAVVTLSCGICTCCAVLL